MAAKKENETPQKTNTAKPRRPVVKRAQGKKTLKAIVKANKTVSMWIGLFIAVVTLIGIIQKLRTKDVTGKWHLSFKNESSTYTPYIGEVHTQEVYFIQNEKSISGDGEKIAYNGQPLPSSQHRKLEYTGVIDGKKIVAKYVLHGERRITNGEICVTVSSDGEKLEGTFSGTAGQCKGSVTGEKLED